MSINLFNFERVNIRQMAGEDTINQLVCEITEDEFAFW